MPTWAENATVRLRAKARIVAFSAIDGIWMRKPGSAQRDFHLDVKTGHREVGPLRLDLLQLAGQGLDQGEAGVGRSAYNRRKNRSR